MSRVISTDPRSGTQVETSLTTTTADEVSVIVSQAAAASIRLAGLSRHQRADLLDDFADAMEERRSEIVPIAGGETGLGDARLNGELSRSAFQMRLFGEALREGSYLEAAIDHAGSTPLGDAPDVRRMLVPVGAVAVFGASNFPFAFSVLGGDTASAIAAGCAVVLKAHDSHPLTSRMSADLLRAVCREHGLPDDTVGLVYGQSAGAQVVADPRIKAVGFTGSLGGGRALLDIIDTRDEPIAFFGELSSLNPLIITEAALRARGDEIAAGLFGSVTGSGGQLCTKPGIAFVPAGPEGDHFVDRLAVMVKDSSYHILLNQRIRDSYLDISNSFGLKPGIEFVHGAVAPHSCGGFAVPAQLVVVDTVANIGEGLIEECFGPFIVVARYGDEHELAEGLLQVPGSLTATIHGEEHETDDGVGRVATAVASRVGRLVFNDYPTGVRVSWAQHHGGPWPATNSQHTSVGVSAIRRFLRPMAWQNAPSSLLPAELQDGATTIPRRVDGVLTLAVP